MTGRAIFGAVGLLCGVLTGPQAAAAAAVPSVVPVPAVHWATQSVQKPPWATGYLSIGNVACLSTTDCLAVGFDQVTNPAGESYPQVAPAVIDHPLVWHWDGASWKFEKVPLTGSVILLGVACPTAGNCWVVGGKLVGKLGNQFVAVVEHGNGTSWAPVPVPSPSGATLNGIACTSAADCLAVGTRQTSPNQAHALVEHWDGRAWSSATPPLPSLALWSVLDSVTCVGPDDCLALGDFDTSSKGSGSFFGERYNGTSWSKFAMPNPKKFNMGSQSALDLSCASSSSCLATGSALAYTNGQLGADFPAAVADSWNGHTWSPVASPSSGQYSLDGDSCVSPADCWVALNLAPPQAPLDADVVIGHWGGGALGTVSLQFKGTLDGISCVQAKAGAWCAGIGQAQAPAKGATQNLSVFGGDFTTGPA